MTFEPELDNEGRSYRRGAVMGLTVAEAFMLIAFALLMLFALWQKESADKLAAVSDILELPAESKAAIITVATDGSLDEMMRLKEEGFDMRSLLADPVLVETERLSRLIDEDTLARLSDAIQKLPDDQRRQLVDLIALDGLPDPVADIAEIAGMLEDGATVDQVREALALQDRLGPGVQSELALLDQLRDGGHDPASLLKEVEAQKERIRNLLANDDNRQQQLVAALEAELGDLVREMGGHIDEFGRITIPNPDGVLFAVGSADITAGMRAFLAKACGPWLTTLRNAQLDVSEIRIEGHASSEWTGARSAEDAYLRNLGLSQSRAQAVLATCLALVDDTDVRDWARSYMTAVGYSSARPVLVDGAEDAPRSRRVVFDAELSTQRLIEDIEREVGVGSEETPTEPLDVDPQSAASSASRYEGRPTVTDADTIRIGETRIRLFGIDAPELTQTCSRADGQSWFCGREASAALERYIAGRPVICDQRDIDQYGRIVAVCYVHGADLGAWLVRQGHALAYRRYSLDYVSDEAAAEASGAGLWSGSFEMPWLVRNN